MLLQTLWGQDGTMGRLFGDLDKCSEDTSQPEWTKLMLGVGGTQMPVSGYFVAGLEGVQRDQSADTGRSNVGVLGPCTADAHRKGSGVELTDPLVLQTGQEAKRRAHQEGLRSGGFLPDLLPYPAVLTLTNSRVTLEAASYKRMA
ncbi:hypothetical protein MJT46_015254 [Ovis ammon polii x Ovis aries]|nr:hypothetical protein MJT46_015254 [Ovis ammon polii x Ovis aries]